VLRIEERRRPDGGRDGVREVRDAETGAVLGAIRSQGTLRTRFEVLDPSGEVVATCRATAAAKLDYTPDMAGALDRRLGLALAFPMVADA